MKSFKYYIKELKTKKYHITIYSNNPKEPTRNINFSKKNLIIYIGLFSVIVILISLFISSILPIKNLFKVRTNNEKLIEIESRIKKISSEMLVLQEYNNILKYALGDTTSKNYVNGNSIDSILNTISDIEINTISKQNIKGNLSDDNSLDIPFSLPISNFLVSQEYDDEENHFGVDFAGKTGDPIFAPADGVVVFSNYTTDYGNTMILVHGNKFLTKYKHNLCNLKSVGSYVHRGEIIAMLGNTGKLSTSPHLHFEIWKNGVPKNPFKYLLIRN